jgi:D-alanine--poly(phosphoribitol) ligase subunit 1
MYFDVASKTFKDESIEADKIAFVTADKALTWLELKTLSDELCKTLEKTNVPKGHPVLVYGDKEAFFLAAILSCYRMGLPFVPINNHLPEKRIEKIIKQTQSQVMIVADNDAAIPQMPVTIKDDFSIHKKDEASFSKTIEAAYILFTSGSSGEPKGVIISNENISSFIQWFVKDFPVNNKTVFINQASFLFDIALADFFGTLQAGATTVFNTDKITANPDLFFERINTYKGTYWNSTPSFIAVYLANKNFNQITLPSITQFVLSGEDLPITLVKELKQRFPDATIINAYGPTEATIYASFAEITDGMLHENSLPISKAANETIYLNEDEIIITGKRIGAGYLNNDSLTQQKFLSVENKKAFCTGDIAFIKGDYIYYKGRKDTQLKLNGYQIEPNEIQHALERIDFVKQAVCMPIIINSRVKRMIAFVILNSTEILLKEGDAIQELLKKELPHYMIPSEIIMLKEFPYTENFKVDKQKLLHNYLSDK